MRSYVLLLLILWAIPAAMGQTSPAERLIAAGHWKQARKLVEARLREAPGDALAHFLLSQIRNAFGDRTSPLALAEKAVALDAGTAKFHRQVAEVVGVMAQHANPIQQLWMARRFRKEIDAALALDPRDVQAHRDLLEFYLLAPGVAGGDVRKAAAEAERIAELDRAEGFLAQARVASFQKRTAEAEAQMRQAAEARPASYRARIVLAQYCLGNGHEDLHTAEALAREAMRMEPDRVDSYAVLAQVYVERSAWTELDALLALAEREAPDDLVPYYRAAERLLACGNNQERARRYLDRYLDQEPEGNQPGQAAVRSLKKLRS